MSDIDFDELDKAVNSLVDDNGDKKVESAPEQKPSGENGSNESPPPANESPSKHSGRFMDLVHSSSDMRKEGSTRMNTSTTNIKPINDNVKAEPINPESSEDDENPTNDSSSQLDFDKDNEGDLSKDQADTPNTDMPDPLDHLPASDDESKDTTKDESKKTDEKSDDKDDSSNPPADTKPELDYEETTPPSDEKDKGKGTTPFLDNAKVKKRPLGGANPDTPTPSDGKKDEAPKSTTETSAEPVVLPPELDKNLVAIESGEAPETPQASAKPPEATEETTTPQEPVNIEKDKKPSAKDQKEEVAQLLASASSGSIPDQYKRENRSHELHAPHPLFNFEHYDSSSAKAAKGPKSTASTIFQWIFIVIGLLLLGGSIGAAVFVFVSKF